MKLANINILGLIFLNSILFVNHLHAQTSDGVQAICEEEFGYMGLEPADRRSFMQECISKYGGDPYDDETNESSEGMNEQSEYQEENDSGYEDSTYQENSQY